MNQFIRKFAWILLFLMVNYLRGLVIAYKVVITNKRRQAVICNLVMSIHPTIEEIWFLRRKVVTDAAIYPTALEIPMAVLCVL